MADIHKLIVGARGWDHSGWNDIFYPGDLPEDWRLSYYANEFSGVLVPESVWRAADPGIFAEWCDDVADNFLFFLELSDSQALNRLPGAAYQEMFGPHWGGVPDTHMALVPADEKWDLRRLRERFDELIAQPRGVTAPAFFLSGDPPSIDRMREARLLADML